MFSCDIALPKISKRTSNVLRTLALASLVAGAAAAHAQIKLGVSGPVEGANAASMLELLQGARLYFDHVNASGGISGQTVEMVVRNDDFKVEKTVEVTRKLINEDRVTAMFLVRGTPHNQAILPLIQEAQVPLVAPSTGAGAFHTPVNKYVYNVRTPYQSEATKLVELLKTINVTKIAVLSVGDSFGRDALVGIKKGFETAGLKATVLQEFDRDAATKDNQDFMKPVLDNILKSDSQALIVIGAGLAVKNAVVAVRSSGSKMRIATISNNASTGFIKLLGDYAPGVIVSQVFPSERSGATSLVRDAMTLAREKKVHLTPAMMEGFTAAKVVVKGLQMAGKSPTRETLQRALENLKSYDLGDVIIGYSSTDHTGVEMTDLSIISNGTFLR